MASFMGFFSAFFLLQVVISEEYCAMHDVCGKRSDGVVLNCAYGSPSVEPDRLFSAQIQSLCPTLTGNVCCTELQFETLRRQLKQATPYLVGCPACLRNYLNLFCELSCSPNQSLFINVNSFSEVSGSMIVDGIDYYITDTFGKGLYNSCKDVKFGPMRKRSIDFIGAGAENFEEWFDFLGEKASPGSPYAIDFKFTAPESSKMQLMNVSTYSCADTSLGCTCDNCPDVCSNSGQKVPSIRIWPIEVKFKSVIWALAGDSIRLAVGIACLIGICIFWMVVVIWHIILNIKFLMGLGLGYIYPVLRPLFRTSEQLQEIL